MMYGWHDGGWGWGYWLTMVLLMIVFWGAIAGVGVVLFRSWRAGTPVAPPPPPPPDGGPRPQPPDEASAMRILEERFARGEIDAEEFSERRELLRSGH